MTEGCIGQVYSVRDWVLSEGADTAAGSCFGEEHATAVSTAIVKVKINLNFIRYF